MSIFHPNIEALERQNNSLIEVIEILENVVNLLKQRLDNKFMPIKLKGLIDKAKNEGFEKECKIFLNISNNLYICSIEYLDVWVKPFEEFNIFKWMKLKEVPAWDNVLESIKYFQNKNISINDFKAFDQFCNLKEYIKNEATLNDINNLSHNKWVKYFNYCENIDVFSELLKIAEFFFCNSSTQCKCRKNFFLN